MGLFQIEKQLNKEAMLMSSGVGAGIGAIGGAVTADGDASASDRFKRALTGAALGAGAGAGVGAIMKNRTNMVNAEKTMNKQIPQAVPQQAPKQLPAPAAQEMPTNIHMQTRATNTFNTAVHPQNSIPQLPAPKQRIQQLPAPQNITPQLPAPKQTVQAKASEKFNPAMHMRDAPSYMDVKPRGDFSSKDAYFDHQIKLTDKVDETLKSGIEKVKNDKTLTSMEKDKAIQRMQKQAENRKNKIFDVSDGYEFKHDRDKHGFGDYKEKLDKKIKEFKDKGVGDAKDIKNDPEVKQWLTEHRKHQKNGDTEKAIQALNAHRYIRDVDSNGIKRATEKYNLHSS